MVGLMLDEILMNNAEVNEWRENLKSDLSVVRNDVEWIKENLGRMDVRQADLTKQVSWLRGMGSIVKETYLCHDFGVKRKGKNLTFFKR